MAQATAKFTYLTTRKIRGLKSPKKERLIVMIANLKGKLSNSKLAPALADKRKKDGGNEKDKDVKTSNVKIKNKENTSNKKTKSKMRLGSALPPKKASPPRRTLVARLCRRPFCPS
jgi:hypothetical protein